MTKDERSAALVRLERIKKELLFLHKHKPYNVKELLTDDMKSHAIERSLEVLLEAVIDIGRLVIATKQLPKASTNKEVFDILGKYKIISSSLAQSIRGVGGMRNILIHDYIDIDYEQILQALDHLDVIQRYTEQITKSLDSD